MEMAVLGMKTIQVHVDLLMIPISLHQKRAVSAQRALKIITALVGTRVAWMI